MRLEVFCEDRLGLTRELLDLLVLRGIDLRGIDIDPIGRIYLNFAELEFASFSSLMAEIRRIAGVTDVRTVPWMPSEREHLALSALLVAMPEPVLSLDTKGKVELANPASCQLFAQSPERLRNHPVAQLITDFNVQRWLESSPQESHSEHVVVNGQNFVLEITPVYLEGEHGERVLTGAVAMLRSTVRMGRQLQTMTTQDTSAFSQILAVGPKMRQSSNRLVSGDAQRAAADRRRYRNRQRFTRPRLPSGQPAGKQTLSGAELWLHPGRCGGKRVVWRRYSRQKRLL